LASLQRWQLWRAALSSWRVVEDEGSDAMEAKPGSMIGGDTKEVKAGVWQGSSLPRLPRHPFHGAPKRKPSEIPATLVK